ncbi:MAG: Gmad2 immunoglobulin-like domain-containing protein [Nocardioidaceae bacterium]
MTQTDHGAQQDTAGHPGPASPPPRGRLLGALAAGLSAAVVITAIVMAVSQGDDEGGTPFGQPTGGTSRDGEAAGGDADSAVDGGGSTSAMHDGVFEPGTAVVTMYYLGPENTATGDVVLFAEPHTVEAVSQKDAVHEFLTSYPIDDDYRSGWPEDVDVTGIAAEGNRTTVALAGAADLAGAGGLDEQAAQMAIQALIRTAGVTAGTVEFTHNGDPVRRLLGVPVGSGVEVLPEQAADFSSSTRAAIQVTSPVEGQAMSNPVVVTGNGNVNEGNVSWQLLDAQGKEVDSGFATTAMLDWADFEVKLGRLDPGTYTFRALEYSMEDGSELNVDDKAFTVQ